MDVRNAVGDANIAERDVAFPERGIEFADVAVGFGEFDGDIGVVGGDHGVVARGALASRVLDGPHEEDQTGLVIADQKEERAVYANAR